MHALAPYLKLNPLRTLLRVRAPTGAPGVETPFAYTFEIFLNYRYIDNCGE